jgi:hypothetical protein
MFVRTVTSFPSTSTNIGFVLLSTLYGYNLTVAIARPAHPPTLNARYRIFEMVLRLPLANAPWPPVNLNGPPIALLLDTGGLRNARMLSNQPWVVGPTPSPAGSCAASPRATASGRTSSRPTRS